ncbi:MAG TPA: ribonuclease III domain-containing protein [Stenomitos sp.]
MHPLWPISYPVSPTCLHTLSPTALAYLGDAVFELYIRNRYLLPPSRMRDYHQQVVACVRAETQAAFAKALVPHLSETEVRILKQGRNAASGQPKRLDLDVYQYATALEALIGYLYLTDMDRLQEILDLFAKENYTSVTP